jgi:hypothetical protein
MRVKLTQRRKRKRKRKTKTKRKRKRKTPESLVGRDRLCVAFVVFPCWLPKVWCSSVLLLAGPFFCRLRAAAFLRGSLGLCGVQ